MIVTLTWKELREHRAIWLTMVAMTCLIGVGLARIVAGDERTAIAVTTLTVLGLAAAYGVVCGAMMFAGEHENGTLVFLDIFHGRRELLWLGKTIIGAFLAVAQGLTVGLALYLLEQAPPDWIQTLVGFGGDPRLLGVGRFEQLQANFWFAVLPVLTLEAYAWGLFGSSITRRVLAAAAVGAAIATPIWLAGLCAPAAPFLIFRAVVALAVTLVSLASFVNQSRETTSGPPPLPVEPPDPRPRLTELWQELERERQLGPDAEASETVSDVVIPVVELAEEEPIAVVDDGPPTPIAELRPHLICEDAESPGQVLWWLTLRQGIVVICVMAAASFLFGVFMPAFGQVLWPVATLLLGVACGTAAFASEQRELSYEFLASQHFPLRSIWRFKIVFWSIVALVCALLIGLSWTLFALIRAAHRPAGVDLLADFRIGTLRDAMGTLAFFTMWLVYGFATAQIVVWFCRKTILALILSGVIALGALSVWLPSLLCRGLTGWQVWLPPIVLLAAGHVLVRAWAGGRIKERRPIGMLIGFAAVALVWVGMVCAYRAWEIPNVGEPMDRVAFRASIPDTKANPAGKKIQEALADFADLTPNRMPEWPTRMAELAALPVGVVEMPLGDGQVPLLRHLAPCEQMTAALRARASRAAAIGQRDAALDNLVQILALSRNLRNKAPLPSYLKGVQIEESAFEGIDKLMAGDKPSSQLLKSTLAALDRHVVETPPPIDCLQTECFRAGGRAANPAVWSFAGPGDERITEAWIVRGIALSYETPWEDARKTRLWRRVWAGLFRGVQTPHWELPETVTSVHGASAATRRILRGWIPAKDGPDVDITADQLAALLEASWLRDETLYADTPSLRSAAHRSQIHTHACRLAVALALYRVDQGKAAGSLQDLVPKYLNEIPTDPYSGEPFRHRISRGEHIDGLGNVLPNQGIVWSTGPDRIDNGGRKHGAAVPDDDPRWSQAGLDLIRLVPH